MKVKKPQASVALEIPNCNFLYHLENPFGSNSGLDKLKVGEEHLPSVCCRLMHMLLVWLHHHKGCDLRQRSSSVPSPRKLVRQNQSTRCPWLQMFYRGSGLRHSNRLNVAFDTSLFTGWCSIQFDEYKLGLAYLARKYFAEFVI